MPPARAKGKPADSCPPPRRAATVEGVIVTCPECGARYRLADDAIPPEGRAMRCAGCSHRWYQAAADAAPVEPELPPALAHEFREHIAAGAVVPQPAPKPEPTPEQLAWHADDGEDDAPALKRHAVLKTVVAAVVGLAVAAGAAVVWLPNIDASRLELLPLDLSQVPWLQRLVDPPAEPASPLRIGFSVDPQSLADGRPLFAISGRIVNPTTETLKVPAIEGHLVDASNTITYRWRIAAPVGTLRPRRAVAFDSSAIGQPYGGERVTLRFAD